MTSKIRSLQSGIWGLLLGSLLAVFVIANAQASPPVQSTVDGEAIFNDNCAGCHTIGGGKSVGPDLKGVTQLRERQWLIDFIASPDTVLAAGDPIAVALLQEYNNIAMPNLNLSQEEVLAVMTHLEAGMSSSGAPPGANMAAGDPERGEDLFMGDIHFANEGPPCMGCHNIGSYGILGGGTLGPDLTGTWAKYGESGLASVLANIAFPTMKPIYDDHPLTADEQADLYAFFKIAANQPQTNKEIWVIGLSLAGFLSVLLLFGFVWRGGLKSVGSRLSKQARTEK